MGALDGLRVLDLSRLAPGPYCSMLLADMGADVLRVDNAVGGPVRSGDMVSRNKRSIALNLKTAAGQRILHRLAAEADVFLEGNRPGVCARLGCDYATLSALNQRLVYCSLTGYGQSGPMAQAAGHDVNYIALAGVLSQIGNGTDPPLPPLNLVADFGGGGLMAAFGILCALFERECSGRGQYIDAAMVDGAASLMAVHFGQKGARSTPGVGLLGGGAAFYRCYECKGGGYVSVGAIEPQFFAALCEGTGVDVVDEQMDTDRWPEHIEAFRRAFLERTRDEWAEVFTELDACVSPVLDLDEAPGHAHNAERGTFPIGPDGEIHIAPAPRLERTPGDLRRREPRMGEHTEDVLTELGFSAEDMVELEEEGAILRT
ncbi:MAG: CaiB/BaiF CoA-transferase family protein [Acidobacteria bacterium]|nr:CaiB/BaiF CoA-transferase family protein [Acidobacteriota bacterium]